MKKLFRIVLVLVLLLLIGVGGLYFYRNHLIRSAVESQASSSLGVKTTLGSANLALFGGTLSLGDLKISSPNGFSPDQMFTLGELGLGVNYSDLRKEPIRVSKITIDKPVVLIEMVNNKFNFQALMDQMGGGSAPIEQNGKPAEPVKLIIDELTLKDATVMLKAPLLPKMITLNIPTVTLKNVGNDDGAQNGAAIKDVVGAMMGALASSASNSSMLQEFGDFKNILNSQAGAVLGKISKQLGDQVNQITKNLGGDIGKTLGGGDLGKTLQGVTGGTDPTKAIGDGLGGLLGGKKDKDKDKKDKK